MKNQAKNILYLNKKARPEKCTLCPKGCLKEEALTRMCLDKIDLDVENVSQNALDANQSAEEIYFEYKKMESISQGNKFSIRAHLKNLRSKKRKKDLNKMIEYLEQKAQLKGKTNSSPLQLILIDKDAQKYKNANLIIAADCAPFVYSDFQKKALTNEENSELILFCPKKTNIIDTYIKKLTYIFEKNNIKSVTVLQTETPCCSEMSGIIKEAIKKANRIIPIKDYTVTISGEII